MAELSLMNLIAFHKYSVLKIQEVIVNSRGGDVEAGLSIGEIIATSKIKITV